MQVTSPLRARIILFAAAIGLFAAGAASATPSLVLDVDSGEVLAQEQGTASWYPASLTKLVTTYVALAAVRDGRVTLDTPFVVSARAAAMAPSKMGFTPGTEVTLGNALKMLMVKSPNDIAVTVAEGISGSVEAFADEMNATAQKLAMHESYFVNPNGLPDDRQVTSARDLALVAQALLKEFPEERGLFGIGQLQFGNQFIRNHNGLLGRYPGVDGMKTGFTCSAGFNVVASAERGGRRLIAVVLGSRSVHDRTVKAAMLLDRIYGGGSTGGQGQLTSFPSSGIQPAPDRRADVCMRRGKSIEEALEAQDFQSPSAGQQFGSAADHAAMFGGFSNGLPPGLAAALSRTQDHFDPVPVFVGRNQGWTGPVAQPRPTGPTLVADSRPVRTRRAPVSMPVEAPLDATAYAGPGGKTLTGNPLKADAAALPLRHAGRKVAARPTRVVAMVKPPVAPSPHKPVAVVKPHASATAATAATRAASKSKPVVAKTTKPAGEE